MPEDAAAAQHVVQHAVALKLPPFWAHKPRVWFAQAEAQFALRDISVDNTRYSYRGCISWQRPMCKSKYILGYPKSVSYFWGWQHNICIINRLEISHG